MSFDLSTRCLKKFVNHLSSSDQRIKEFNQQNSVEDVIEEPSVPLETVEEIKDDDKNLFQDLSTAVSKVEENQKDLDIEKQEFPKLEEQVIQPEEKKE